MKSQKLITASEEPISRGMGYRKIYTITEEGKRTLAEYVKDFDFLSCAIRRLVGLDQE